MVQELHETSPQPHRIELGRSMLEYYQSQIAHLRTVDITAEVEEARQIAEYSTPLSFTDQIAVQPDRALDWATRLVSLTEKHIGLLEHAKEPDTLRQIRDEINNDAIQASFVYCQMFGRYHHEVQYVQAHETATAEDVSTLRGNGEMVEQWRKRKMTELDNRGDAYRDQELERRAIAYVTKPEDGLSAAKRLMNLIKTTRDAVQNK